MPSWVYYRVQTWLFVCSLCGYKEKASWADHSQPGLCHLSLSWFLSYVFSHIYPHSEDKLFSEVEVWLMGNFRFYCLCFTYHFQITSFCSLPTWEFVPLGNALTFLLVQNWAVVSSILNLGLLQTWNFFSHFYVNNLEKWEGKWYTYQSFRVYNPSKQMTAFLKKIVAIILIKTIWKNKILNKLVNDCMVKEFFLKLKANGL